MRIKNPYTGKMKMNQREKHYVSLYINGGVSPEETVFTRIFPDFQFILGTYGAWKCVRSFAGTAEVSQSFLSSPVKPVITDILHTVFTVVLVKMEANHMVLFLYVLCTYKVFTGVKIVMGKCNTPAQKLSLTESILLPFFQVCLQFVPLCSNQLLSSITDRQSWGTLYH